MGDRQDLTGGEKDKPQPASVPVPGLDERRYRAQDFWNPRLETVRQAASDLYAPDAAGEEAGEREAEAAEMFLADLRIHSPEIPLSADRRLLALSIAAQSVLRAVRISPARPFIEDSIAIALRPVRRLRAGSLTVEVCALLYDCHRGVWAPHLTRSQQVKIHAALSLALAALPPDGMEAFWDGLHGTDALMREAMQLGLEFLTAQHAYLHLLHGLEHSNNSGIRIGIVNSMAQIGDPVALPQLYSLRRTAALKDWPLARRITAAIKVIEHLNRDREHRLLLRPASQPADSSRSLLRPASDETFSDPVTLLRATSASLPPPE